jgi:hypothetical protein
MPRYVDDILAGYGDSFDNETLTRNLKEWEADVMAALKARHPDIEDSLKFMTTIPLEKLPVKIQAQFMARYRKIIGLDYVLNALGEQNIGSIPGYLQSLEHLEGRGITGGTGDKIARIWDALRPMKNMASENAYARFPFAPYRGGMINRIYANMNLQFRDRIVQGTSGVPLPRETPGGPSNYFTVGRSSIATVDSLDRTTTGVPSLAGKNVTVFDIETAGLVRNQIREIAYQTFRPDASGKLGTGVANRIGLRPSQFARGVMYEGGKTLDLEQFMHSKFGINVSGMRANSGDDFIDAVMPFLQTVERSDYLVGHNIAGFDIEQIFVGLSGTKRYKNKEEFRTYVDNMHKKMRSSTIDTLELVRNSPHLQDLKLAAQLGPEGTVYSISNLLLKTNLTTLMGIEELAGQMGYDAATGAFTKGLHHGDVDAMVTSAILNNIDKLRVKSSMRSGYKGQKQVLAQAIEKQIVSSAALTPTTNIRDRANILPAIRDYWDRFGTGDLKVTPLQQAIYAQRDLGFGVRPDLTDAELNPQAMSTRVRMFERYKGLGLEKMRERLAANFVPFAGLSIEERSIGTALARATAHTTKVGTATASLAADTMISGFEAFDPNTIQYGTFSGRATIPARILQDAGLLTSEADRPSLLRMSAVDTSIYNDKRAINLVFGFESQEQIQQLTNRMQALVKDPKAFYAAMGMGDATDEAMYHRFRKAIQETDLVKNLTESGLEKGVSIAQIYTDQEKVKDIFDILGDFTIRDVDKLRDEDTFKIALPFMDIDESGIVRTAGAVMPEFLTDEDMSFIGQSVKQAKRVREEGFMNMMGNREARVFASILDRNYGEKTMDITQKAMSTYVTSVRPNLGKFTVGALGAGAALLLYNRKREQDRYDVTIRQMPATDTNRYAIAEQLQARIDTGYDGYRQQIDPLATASVMSNLHATRIGHTNMGWDRNTNLYGGVL